MYEKSRTDKISYSTYIFTPNTKYVYKATILMVDFGFNVFSHHNSVYIFNTMN